MEPNLHAAAFCLVLVCIQLGSSVILFGCLLSTIQFTLGLTVHTHAHRANLAVEKCSNLLHLASLAGRDLLHSASQLINHTNVASHRLGRAVCRKPIRSKVGDQHLQHQISFIESI